MSAAPATNTKIERITEATEALVLATVVRTTEKLEPNQGSNTYQNVLDARAELREAFDELLKPVLRVVK